MDKSAEFCFHDSLNDFLPPSKKRSWFSYDFKGTPSIKDAIEAIGIPHPEIGGIRVNGSWVEFSYPLRPHDRAEVYSLSTSEEALRLSPLLRAFPMPKRFILDVHLGSLARKLRMLGFDSLYENHLDDPTIASLAAAENRLVLSRDVGLLKHKSIEWGYWLRSQNPEEQLKEVIEFCQLQPPFAPFTRCINCNGIIDKVPKEAVEDQLPPKTRRYFEEFYQCQTCKNVYWKGSHYDRMLKMVNEVEKGYTKS